MTDLQRRVVARLSAARDAGDAAPLHAPDAVDDALALLREAAPSPEGSLDLDALAAVFWTFWFRTGPDAPDAERSAAFAAIVFGFLQPRVPGHVQLPEPLRESFDPTDPAHDARFGYLVSSAHGDVLDAHETAGPDRLVALDRALAWSDTALRLLPQDHDGFVELTLHALRVQLARFQLAAEPEALAVAARHGRVVCERLPGLDPAALGPVAAAAMPLALGTVLDAARLLGEPSLAEVERLVAAAPDEMLTPEAGEGLRLLRELHAEPADWPGELDLRVGAAVAEAGTQEHDAGRIACAVRRLRSALVHTPPGHPAHLFATATLSEALDALARETGDDEAAREAAGLAAELLAHADDIGAVSGEDRELLTVLAELHETAESDDPEHAQQVGPLLSRVVEQFQARAAQHDAPLDIDLETLGITAAFSTGDPVSDQQIARYRAALATVPAERPLRYAYVAVLAALTGLRARQLREAEPDGAARLDAEARSLTGQAAAGAPAGLQLFGLLHKGAYDAALSVATMTVLTGEPDGRADPEAAKVVSRLSRMADIRLDDPGRLGADIAALRELLADLAEDETVERAELSAVLGSALASRAAALGDAALLEEAVPLLRHARSHLAELPAGTDGILAWALTALSAGRLDAEEAREAAVLLADMAAGGPPDDIVQAAMTDQSEFFNALQNYMLGHETAQLDRARQSALRLQELDARATDEERAQLPGLEVLGEDLLNLLESVGPGGGPKAGITDGQIDRCRETFAACPPGHPRRFSSAMTLMRTLILRAFDIRAEDREHALRLVGEAGHLVDAVEAEAPQDWAGTMRPLVSMIAAMVLGRRLPPVVSERAPGGQGREPANAVEAVLAPLLNRLAGVADPTALRDPRIPVWFRAHAEIGAAAGALGRPQPRIDLALSHLEAAVEAMPGITDRGSDPQSAEHALTSFEGDIRAVVELVLVTVLVRDGTSRLQDHVKAVEAHVAALEEAVAAAPDAPRLPDAPPGLTPASLRSVEGPDVDRATALLERGRGLLLSRRLEARADLSELRSAYPALAAAFERLTDQLSAEPGPDGYEQPERARLAGLRASRALDELIEDIRSRPGFAGFLRPLSAERLRSLAADGPVVLLNHARRVCHALVVTDRSITALCLDAESDDIADAARRLREAISAINAQGTSRLSPAELVAAGATVRRTLSWTWHRIVRPVLDLVGAGEPVSASGPWPRIWWVPTGAFNALPLHAAQCTLPDCSLDDCGAALDAVVSSYVPGFQTLAYARSRAEHRDTAGGDSALLVASPEGDLPGVAAATRYAAGLLGAHEPLIGAAATREAVLAALGSTPWAHFGCHAATDPAEPSGALLHLPSGEPLSVREVCRARPHAARLAFLAACGTARASERLSDEAVHITSAFLLAGFPAAVGTLWEIDSTHAEHVTRAFYRRAAGADGGPSADALHHTVRELRHDMPNSPHIWAAYVHAGV
ncbi:CHAT domain-containing protein [Streptomyces sp. NPDC001339]|uniref:CHAT domain-containing protein n=1 Tax=Streptomyces sp. NPDC001339 TaxID=3364563 RepID=UPI003694EC2C